jgi:hypothetical protein
MRLALLLLLFRFCMAPGQSISISEFLKSAGSDEFVKTAKAKGQYLQSKPYKLSPLQRLEFRTQNRELSRYNQEYAFRFTPANPWEVKSNNQYFSQYQSFIQIERQVALKSALLDRYFAIVEYLYRLQLKTLAEHSLALTDKKLAMMDQLRGSSFFDADEYVELKIDQLEKSGNRDEAELEWSQQQALIYSLYPTAAGMPIDFAMESIISVDRIERVADSLKSKEIHSLLVAYRQQRIQMDRCHYLLEKYNFNFGFLQTEYDDRRANQNRTPFNIGLGITIPITNPNKGDMARRQLDVIEAEQELKVEEAGNAVARTSSYQQLKASIQRYRSITEKISGVESSRLADDLTMIKGGDPLVRLQFESALLKMKSVQVKFWRMVLTQYVNYLAASDHVQQQPVVNFLSGRLTQLEP